ncbi:MAG TPA: RiPP maturation radical SAM C-methyltransferase [Amycolatopsis sp.]|uniref:RiPP maturation radical SAM C-methyltransferase n=1 Tax=Amycolatopsis sp. TaxID=37632 RepID=UPI002B490ACD|nr:RiPP maturation radical SAM C-methyltransferase [Amycolatopsis sp.]HKS46198.1 RiPP maturation radical SAM C-methyltransferase [Amycolatopsis sp.]
MRVVLVNMPWASIAFPSLALGILKRRVADEIPGGEVEVVNANIEFVDWLTDRAELAADEYEACASGNFSAYSEWIFSSALYDDPHYKASEFCDRIAGQVSPSLVSMADRLHRVAPDFVRQLAERIAAASPDVVGFTTMFSQNTAALAGAKAVKRFLPDVATVLGGANCDGEQGAALHRNFDFVDFVVRGEGEIVLPQLVKGLCGGADIAGLPGLCRRLPDGSSVANPMDAKPLPPAVLVPPDYDGYYEQHAASRAGTWVEPKIVVESSRGCWWGAKHHCTFCGLNGSFMEYRSKRPGRFVDELLALVEKHRVLDVIVSDNILDMGYLTSALPKIQEAGYDLRISYEIKANLRLDQLRTLRNAGITYVQPGIENLNSHVLHLMDKGVSGCQNVRLLRDAETLGLNVAWNYLYGFPGETNEDYTSILDQMPTLYHLTPAHGATRLLVERFSPYFNRPELGFRDVRPGEYYSLIYDLPERELHDLVYLFDSAPQGIDEAVVARLERAVDEWKLTYPGCRLSCYDLDEGIVLVNSRPAFEWRVLHIDDPAETAVFRLLDQPHTVPALVRKLTAAGFQADAAWAGELLRRWRELGLVFHDADSWVHVAPTAASTDLLRLADREIVAQREQSPALVPALA